MGFSRPPPSPLNIPCLEADRPTRQHATKTTVIIEDNSCVSLVSIRWWSLSLERLRLLQIDAQLSPRKLVKLALQDLLEPNVLDAEERLDPGADADSLKAGVDGEEGEAEGKNLALLLEPRSKAEGED